MDLVRILFDKSLSGSQSDYANVFLKYETFKDSDFFILLMFLEAFYQSCLSNTDELKEYREDCFQKILPPAYKFDSKNIIRSIFREY